MYSTGTALKITKRALCLLFFYSFGLGSPKALPLRQEKKTSQAQKQKQSLKASSRQARPFANVFPYRKGEFHKRKKQMRLEHFSAQLLWYLRTGQEKPAHALFKKMQHAFPQSAGRKYFQAIALYHNGQKTQALMQLQKALKQKPDFRAAWNLKGVVLTKLEHYEQAEEAFAKSLLWNPYEARYHYNMAFAYYQQGEYEDALDYARKAVELKANFAKPHYLQALIYQKKKKLRRAVLAFRLAEEFGQEGAQFWIDYIALLDLRGEGKRAAALGAKLIAQAEQKKENDDIRLWRSLAQLWKRQGQYKQSLLAFERFVYQKNALWQEQKDYVTALLYTGHDEVEAFISKMHFNKQEKKEIRGYAKNLLATLKQKAILQAYDPILFYSPLFKKKKK